MSWLLALFWMLVVIIARCHLVATSSNPNAECTKYELIKDEDRSINYKSKPGHYKCDRDLFKKNTWFRFVWPSGSRMPTSPPQTHRCGGRSSGWVKEAHPTKLNQRKTVTVCFPWPPNKDCLWSQKIKVTMCNGFFVYQLKPTPNCDLRYCGNGKNETLVLPTRVINPTQTVLSSTILTTSCVGAADCFLMTKPTWQSVNSIQDVSSTFYHPTLRSDSVTATPIVDVQVTKHHALSVKTLSVIVALSAVLFGLLIAIFSCIIVRAMKRKRCENILRSKNTEENTDVEIVLDATVVYSSTDKHGYLIPVDGKKECFYQGLKSTRESFYQPLKSKTNQSAPTRKLRDDDTENSASNKRQRHRQVSKENDEASSPLWTNYESLHPHSPQVEERVYDNEFDQNSLKKTLLKKKSHLSFCTESKNSLFTDIDDKENLMFVPRRKKERFIPDPKEYDNSKDYDPKVTSLKMTADRSSVASEPDLTKQNAGDDYSQQEPMYYVLEAPDP